MIGARITLNIDGGEHDDEPVELYALADIIHVACGGHAGDNASMSRVIEACKAHKTRVGAHPSYVDREGFGRRALVVDPALLEDQIATQCAALRRVSEAHGGDHVSVTSAKPHGALYHAAHGDVAIADACVRGIARALGSSVTIVGLANGELEAASKRAGHPFAREAFADRGTRDDGSLIPRGSPGAVIDDPEKAAERARYFVKLGTADTLCIHGDTPSALAIARAVRAVLDP